MSSDAAGNFLFDFFPNDFAAVIGESEGMMPLETGFVFASAEPIGIAEVFVNQRIAGSSSAAFSRYSIERSYIPSW